MIVRFVASFCVLIAGAFILYIPSAHPPEHFLDQLRIEHEMNADFWGPGRAAHIMERMLDWQGEVARVSAFPQTVASNPPATALDAAVASEMTKMTARMFNNRYFKSIDTLLVLATYRFSAFVEWVMLGAVFVLAAWVDGFARRLVKNKEFLHYSPELFGLHLATLIVLLCATAVAFVVPLTLHPLVLATVPFGVAACGSCALANFHHRG
jgi:hypothetical protein